VESTHRQTHKKPHYITTSVSIARIRPPSACHAG